ncbi:MAG: cytochrome c [Saprospirales bacterium]|nr:cytochrome c [Saprospirales bacterium]
MKRTVFLFVFFHFWVNGVLLAQNGAQDLFNTKCGICHTIGKGKLVGPDLAGVQDRHPQEWLLNFVRSSQKMIASGDSAALALFEQNNKVVMPDPMISDAEIESVLAYILENSAAGAGAVAYTSIIDGATPEDFENGRQLFEGRVRFANAGPSCITCHNGLAKTFFNDNSFSVKDLSTSFANLGEQGVRAILENPPFPVMKQAFTGKNLTEAEVHDLLVFLKKSGGSGAQAKMPSGLLLFGLLGAGALVLLYSALWYSRKSRSVNHGIYKRQIKSLN